VTGHHRGLKHKPPAHYRVPSDVLCAISHIFVYWSTPSVRDSLFFIVECGITRFLCAMPVFKLGHQPHPLCTFVPNFVSFAAHNAELPMEKHRVLNHSLNQLISQLIWCRGNGI